jgi:DNA-binding transcriptional regulator YhcF (GntR family)
MITNGFISLHRSLLKWEWYDDINTTRLFIHLLLTVNHYDEKWHGIEIKRGQRVLSIQKLASEIQLTIQQTKTALQHLKSTNEITSVTSPQNTIITILQYDKYQTPTNKTTNYQQTDIEKSTNKSTNEQQLSNNTNKSNKEINNNICILGSQKNVKLTDKELLNLQKEYPNDIDNAIEFLSLYISDKGYKTKGKTHNIAIQRWVIKAVQKNGFKIKHTPIMNNPLATQEVPEYTPQYGVDLRELM